jgi:spermidine synthase
MSRRTLNDFAEHHVLIIGGGDGCAAREVLKWYNVTSVTIVDHDGTFVNQFAKTVLSDLNQNVYSNPKCKYVEQDAVSFLKDGTNLYDVILIDLPDPDSPVMLSLYLNVIEACKSRLNPRCGSIGMHVGPAILDRNHRNWHTIHACKYKLASVFGGKIDFGTVHVPSFSNEWAFLWMSVGNARYTPEQYVADRCGYWTTTERSMSRDMNALYFL